ncbi:adenylyl-sulfate kinase [Nocardioides sp.]|uniref:adenylyl-sulfate kinase n=1 Tax=Nocardioides sp. TaxID=35761 RepID=UPI0027279A42|nr:adenylyl-sulfate kinase [Nocardioides sp.]MDO9454936.1 adenylyl-sulfate kinase [Nocardioides sp.]
MSSPQHCPTQRELDDLELLTSGALAPLTAYGAPGSPVTLTLPPELADAPTVELVDPEGLPLAHAHLEPDGSRRVEALTTAQHGPFRRLYLSPAQVRDRYAGRTFVPVTGPVSAAQLAQLQALGPLVLLALVGHGTPDLSAVALLRATVRVADALGADVVAVPLADHGDPEADHALGVQVVSTYAAGDPVVGLVEDDGDPLPELDDILDADQPPPDRVGLVLFFTGLSGSGKSTLARALMDRMLEQGTRTVTTLDGDVVRRHLSAGLTFSKADRETNLRRIGWVAAEIARHGGVAVCSPIAPFDETRRQVREMVDEAGGAFFLVHVATPLEECERRDRKGLYAKARRGEIPEFTGISSPYEEPTDADVRVDTTGRTIDDALTDVLDELAAQGYADLRDPVASRLAPLAPQPTDPPTSVEVRGALATSLETPAATDQPVHTEAEEVAPAIVTRPLKVLFVCTANICRSPYIELTARAQAGGAPIEFTSAGTHGFTGQPMNPPMAEAFTRHHPEAATTVETFASRQLTRAMVEDADLVVTAEASHRGFVLDETPGAFRKVFTLGQLAEAVQRLPEGLDRADLLRSLGERRGTAAHALDVVDPYGRGSEAAEACATHIDTLLGAVVPRLAAAEAATADAGTA